MFKNFSMSWFTTTPGILTMLGILLILISIVIFISTIISNKKKVKTKEGENVVNEQATIPDVSLEAPVQNNIPVQDPTVNLQQVSQNNEVVETANLGVNPFGASQVVTPGEPVINPINVEPVITPVEPVVNPINVEPVITPVEPMVNPVNVEPVITPTINQVDIQPNPVAQQAPVEVAQMPTIEPVVNPVNAMEPNVTSIQEPLPYGGVSPTATIPNAFQTEQKIIYGGADPLYGTGVMPTIEPEIKKTDDIESL